MEKQVLKIKTPQKEYKLTFDTKAEALAAKNLMETPHTHAVCKHDVLGPCKGGGFDSGESHRFNHNVITVELFTEFNAQN